MVDPANTVVEQNNDNNSFTAPSQLVVGQAPGPDLQVTRHHLQPAEPGGRRARSRFTVAVNNRGTSAAARPPSPG